jgi:hypothetical protein
MKDIMESNLDILPVQVPLKEVFICLNGLLRLTVPV